MAGRNGGARRGKPSGLCTGVTFAPSLPVSGFICSKPRWSSKEWKPDEQGLQQILQLLKEESDPRHHHPTVQQVSFARPRRARRFAAPGPLQAAGRLPPPLPSPLPDPSALRAPAREQGPPAAAAAPARRLAHAALVPRVRAAAWPGGLSERPGAPKPLPAIATCASVGRHVLVRGGPLEKAERLGAGADPGESRPTQCAGAEAAGEARGRAGALRARRRSPA